MSIRDLVPWGHKRSVPVRREDDGPFAALQREVNGLFDGFFRDFPMAPFRGLEGFAERFSPRVNVVEGEKDVKVSVELPGMDEKDVDVTLADGVVTIKGEKKEEHEDKGKGFQRVERSYGSFERSVALPQGLEDEKAEAEFAKGVLTVTVPKGPAAQKLGRKIEVKRG